MAKIGIYGGSFNPVHFGHIGLMKWVLANTDLDAIWMMVSPRNPLKGEELDDSYTRRLEAARVAVESLPSVKVSDFENTLPRPSYTANTLRELSKRFPEHEFTLIIGEDNWQIFDRWREYDYILNHFRVFVYPRHSEVEAHKELTKKDNPIFLSGAPYFDISSTEIREKSKQNIH